MLKMLAVIVVMAVAGTQASAQSDETRAELEIKLRDDLLSLSRALDSLEQQMTALLLYQDALRRRLEGGSISSMKDIVFPKNLCAGDMQKICLFLPITTGYAYDPSR
tara:strand:+ start:1519 stop:1839 length:321 start_codon:yes stop_codon:yes gene_type:complete